MAETNSGENVIAAVRMGGLGALAMHTYVHYFTWFEAAGYAHPELTKRLAPLASSWYFDAYWLSYAAPLACLTVAAMAERVRKSEKGTRSGAVLTLVVALAIYGAAPLAVDLLGPSTGIYVYGALAVVGFAAVMVGLTALARVLGWNLQEDLFNEEGRSFPQEERLLTNQYSVNLRTRYRLGPRRRSGWINMVNPFRGTAVMGTPGSGKTFAVINEIIRQLIGKGFAMYVYDFKFPDLTNVAYNALRRSSGAYEVTPEFFVVNFDDMTRTHRCNPLAPRYLTDIPDALEASTTILLNLNKTWITKQGEFFSESAINLLAAVIWYLRVTEDGRCSSLPHAIQFLTCDYDKIFPLMNSVPALQPFVGPFASALERGATDQLEGQVASLRLAMARITGEQVYWVLSGDDLEFDLNNPERPKIFCIGNNPERQGVYSAALGLINSRVTRSLNKKGGIPSAVVVDELPTLYFRELDNLIATARSNRVATVLGFQDMSQLARDYGDKVARAIFDTCANVFSGQVRGSTAKELAERFGRTKQLRRSVSENRNDTSFSQSTQLIDRIPSSRISSLSQGEFVGIVSDSRDQPLPLKVFDAAIEIDTAKLARESADDVALPAFSDPSATQIRANYVSICRDVEALVTRQMSAIASAT